MCIRDRSEQLLFDEKTGRPLNNNLLDYKLSTIMDHPHLEAQFVENAEPTSAFGTKALGEPPACSGAPAIRNAIYNATGVAIDQDVYKRQVYTTLHTTSTVLMARKTQNTGELRSSEFPAMTRQTIPGAMASHDPARYVR